MAYYEGAKILEAGELVCDGIMIDCDFEDYQSSRSDLPCWQGRLSPPSWGILMKNVPYVLEIPGLKPCSIVIRTDRSTFDGFMEFEGIGPPPLEDLGLKS